MTLHLHFLQLAAALSAWAFTLTRSDLFDGLRTRVAKRSELLGLLVSCPYCASHWLGAIALAGVRQRLWLSDNAVIDYGATWLALVYLAALCTGLLALATNATKLIQSATDGHEPKK